MDPKQLHEAEQAMAFMADNISPFWKRLYDNLKRDGFSNKQAFDLLKVYVAASNARCGVHITYE